MDVRISDLKSQTQIYHDVNNKIYRILQADVPHSSTIERTNSNYVTFKRCLHRDRQKGKKHF